MSAKKTSAKNKSATGRPPKYQASYPKQAAKLCRLGATDDDLADFFGVVPQTVRRWKIQHKEFCAALKRSKDELDAQVEQSLFRRAMGYSHRAVKMFQAGGAILTKEFVEYYPPDTVACIFWLKNRQPDKWRQNPDPEGDDAPPPARVEVTVVDGRKDA